jgi:hypothetical protein
VIASQGNGVVTLGLGNGRHPSGVGAPEHVRVLPALHQECYFMADYAIKTLKAKSIALVYGGQRHGQGAASLPTYALTHGATAFTTSRSRRPQSARTTRRSSQRSRTRRRTVSSLHRGSAAGESRASQERPLPRSALNEQGGIGFTPLVFEPDPHLDLVREARVRERTSTAFVEAGRINEPRPQRSSRPRCMKAAPKRP